MSSEPVQLDIVIPVYNEGRNILGTLHALAAHVRTPHRVLICYDFDEDDTLLAIREHGAPSNLDLELVKNKGRGAHQAVITGFEHSRTPCVLVYPADDDFNADIVDRMVQKAKEGNDIVCASRFMAGGSMVGCPWLKAFLVRMASFTLYHLAGIPTHDSSSGFRMFSRRLLDRVQIESCQGFTYSIELLAKCHRLGWPIAEVPAQWRERAHGQSRFRVIQWLPAYLRWYLYIFATRFLRRQSVPYSFTKSEIPLSSKRDNVAGRGANPEDVVLTQKEPPDNPFVHKPAERSRKFSQKADA